MSLLLECPCCSNHGGKSLKGFGHRNYKHGCYSKYDVLVIWVSYELQIRALKWRLERYEPWRREARAALDFYLTSQKQ